MIVRIATTLSCGGNVRNRPPFRKRRPCQDFFESILNSPWRTIVLNRLEFRVGDSLEVEPRIVPDASNFLNHGCFVYFSCLISTIVFYCALTAFPRQVSRGATAHRGSSTKRSQRSVDPWGRVVASAPERNEATARVVTRGVRQRFAFLRRCRKSKRVKMIRPMYHLALCPSGFCSRDKTSPLGATTRLAFAGNEASARGLRRVVNLGLFGKRSQGADRVRLACEQTNPKRPRFLQGVDPEIQVGLDEGLELGGIAPRGHDPLKALGLSETRNRDPSSPRQAINSLMTRACSTPVSFWSSP